MTLSRPLSATRLREVITGKIAYTWSHSIDDSSSQVSGASFGNSVSGLPAFNLRLDRGDSDFDVRHVFSANAVAPLPNIKRGGAYTSILRKWTLTNIFTIRSGIPFTPIVGGDPLGLLGSAAMFQFPPDRTVRTRSCTNGHNDQLHRYLLLRLPRNVRLRSRLCRTTSRHRSPQHARWAQVSFSWTAGLIKDQPCICERFHAQFQVQALFNLTNHTNFANPAASAQTQIFNVNGGIVRYSRCSLTSAATPGRQLQFALKLLF